MNLPSLPLPYRPLGMAAAVVGLLLVAATGCSEKKAAAPMVPVVEVVQVVQKDVPIYMEWVGTMDGNINAVIRPQVTGYLIRQNYR